MTSDDLPFALRSWKNFREWKDRQDLVRNLEDKLTAYESGPSADLEKEIIVLATRYKEITGVYYVRRKS